MERRFFLYGSLATFDFSDLCLGSLLRLVVFSSALEKRLRDRSSSPPGAFFLVASAGDARRRGVSAFRKGAAASGALSPASLNGVLSSLVGAPLVVAEGFFVALDLLSVLSLS